MSDSGEQATVYVRRQGNERRIARYRLQDMEGFHFSDTSGGVQATANRKYLCCYVWCDAMLDGELGHSCAHGKGPHRIKVCIVQKDNPKSVYQGLLSRL